MIKKIKKHKNIIIFLSVVFVITIFRRLTWLDSYYKKSFEDNIPVKVQKAEFSYIFADNIGGRYYAVYEDSHQFEYFGKTSYSTVSGDLQDAYKKYQHRTVLVLYNHNDEAVATFYWGAY